MEKPRFNENEYAYTMLIPCQFAKKCQIVSSFYREGKLAYKVKYPHNYFNYFEESVRYEDELFKDKEELIEYFKKYTDTIDNYYEKRIKEINIWN